MAADPSRVEAGDAHALFAARVSRPLAPMHLEPWIASQQVSQQLAGHVVMVLEERERWVRALGVDEYEGWMHSGQLSRLPLSVARTPRDPAMVSLGCRVRDGRDARRELPLLALLSIDEKVIEGEAVSDTDRPGRFPLSGTGIGKTACEYFAGTSYVWGGVTPWGADCSGMVQTAYALHGLQLPRDAWQQAERGSPVEGGLDAAQAGDLLFFTALEGGRISHVGIALGSNRMVHLGLGRGGYAVERLDHAHDPYVIALRERFAGAKRMLGVATDAAALRPTR